MIQRFLEMLERFWCTYWEDIYFPRNEHFFKRLFTSTLEVWESGLIDTRESLEIVANKISIVTSYYKGEQKNAIKVSFVEVSKIPANIFWKKWLQELRIYVRVGPGFFEQLCNLWNPCIWTYLSCDIRIVRSTLHTDVACSAAV